MAIWPGVIDFGGNRKPCNHSDSSLTQCYTGCQLYILHISVKIYGLLGNDLRTVLYNNVGMLATEKHKAKRLQKFHNFMYIDSANH